MELFIACTYQGGQLVETIYRGDTEVEAFNACHDAMMHPGGLNAARIWVWDGDNYEMVSIILPR